jgi:hypothetical protein
VVGGDLAREEAAPGAIPVVLENGEEASGLAYMLHQFIEQTLEEGPGKRRRARSLSGQAVFCAAEDEEISVRIVFGGDRIELHDGGGAVPPGVASITADFLTIAHLTSGKESPFGLLARQKLRARFRLRQLPFLLRMLEFMKSEDPDGAAVRRRRLVWLAAGVAVGVGAIYVLVST